MLANASSRIPVSLADRVTIVNKDFKTANVKPGSFDLIICIGVMAYIDDVR